MPALNEKHPPTPKQEFIEQLSLASYHYADDSAGEWSQARECVRRAAVIAHDNGWDEDTVRNLYIGKKQLVDINEVLNAMRREGETRARLRSLM